MNKPPNHPETVYNIMLDSKIQILRSNAALNPAKGPSLTNWSIFGLFGCCSTCPNDKISSHPKKMPDETDWATAKALSHYRVSDTGSFVDFQKTNSTFQGTPDPSIKSNDEVFQDIRGSLEDLLLLGNVTEKIIGKLEKIHLRSRTLNSGDFSVCGINSCIKSTSYEKAQGSKVSQSLYANHAAEVIAEHIGRSFQDSLVIDVNCGRGGYAIQFARHSNTVIAIERDAQKLSNAKSAAKSYNIENNMEFIQADFLSMRNLRADVVLLTPPELKLQEKTSFSILRHLTPDLEKLIAHSVNISPNICIELPYHVQIEEIGELFAKLFDSNDMKLEEKYQYSIRIQQLYIDDRPDCLIIYFGSCSQVQENDIIAYLCKLLAKYEPSESKVQYDQALVQVLIQTLGARFIIKILLLYLQNKTDNTNQTSILKVIYESAISDEGISSKLLSALNRDQILASAFRSSGCVLDFNFSAIKSNTGNPLINISGSAPEERLMHSDDESYPIARSYCRAISQKMSPNAHPKDLYVGSCKEVDAELSEILVSSYSLKSAAMLDSEAESLKTRNIPSCQGSLLGSTQKQAPRTLSSISQIRFIKEEAAMPSSKVLQQSDFKRSGPRKILDLHHESSNQKSYQNSVKDNSPQTHKRSQREIAFGSEVTNFLKLGEFTKESWDN